MKGGDGGAGEAGEESPPPATLPTESGVDETRRGSLDEADSELAKRLSCTRAQLAQWRDSFNEIDKDQSGTCSMSEFRGLL